MWPSGHLVTLSGLQQIESFGPECQTHHMRSSGHLDACVSKQSTLYSGPYYDDCACDSSKIKPNLFLSKEKNLNNKKSDFNNKRVVPRFQRCGKILDPVDTRIPIRKKK